MTFRFNEDWVAPLQQRLRGVGLEQGPDEDIGGMHAAAWVGSYAQVLLLPIKEQPKAGWSDLLDTIDREVIRRLREAEQSGGVVDAHVCLILGEELQRDSVLTTLDLQAASRRFSRKYLINQSEGIEGVLQRLTILGPGEISASRALLGGMNVSNPALLERISNNPAKALARQFLATRGFGS